MSSAHVLRDRAAPHTGATRRHQRAAEGLPTLLVPLNQSFDVHTGVGPRCGALPGYKPVNTYNNRAPIRVAEALSRLAEGKRFVEIGTRRGDVFMCVAGYAVKTTVVEADPKYCDYLSKRAATGSNVDVQCPVMFGAGCPSNQRCVRDGAKYSIPDADVYYSCAACPRLLHASSVPMLCPGVPRARQVDGPAGHRL